MNKILFFFIFLLSFSFVSAQKSVNDYEYVLVPRKFDFQKSQDLYQLNSLTKFLFNRAGFKVFFADDILPKNVAENRCLALVANVINDSSLLTTKLKINLVDCYNNVVFTTEIGKSKEKDFKKAFHQALRSTFVHIEELNYKYNSSSSDTEKNVVIIKEDVKPVKEPVKEPVKPKEVKEVKEVKQVKKEKPLVSKIEKEKVEQKVEVVEKVKIKPSKLSIVGSYMFTKWGKSKVIEKGENYVAIGGDENFEFATIYKTSKPTIFIIKWVTSKQPQLVEITKEGNLKIDSKNGVEVANRL